MKTNDLLVCTIKMLKLLSDLFYAGKVDFSVLRDHTQIKLDFLEDKLDEFENANDRKLALDILQVYRTIFSHSGCR